MPRSSMTKEELTLNIKVLANANKITGLSNSERKAAKKLATQLRREYRSQNASSGARGSIAHKKPVRLNSSYIVRLINKYPNAGWAELSRKAYSDGYPYEAGAIRNHVRNVLGINR